MTINKDEALHALLTRIDDIAENFERHGEVCCFEGNAMIYADTLTEIVTLRGEYHVAATSHIAPDAAAIQAEPIGYRVISDGSFIRAEEFAEGDHNAKLLESGAVVRVFAPAIAPEASELPEIPHHPEMTFAWSSLERAAIKKYGEECARAAIAMHRAAAAKPDWLYETARNLALAIWRDNYRADAPEFEPLDDLAGVVSQIDNMVSGMTRKAASDQVAVEEPVTAEMLTDEQRKKLEFIVELTHDYHQRVAAQVRILLATKPAASEAVGVLTKWDSGIDIRWLKNVPNGEHNVYLAAPAVPTDAKPENK